VTGSGTPITQVAGRGQLKRIVLYVGVALLLPISLAAQESEPLQESNAVAGDQSGLIDESTLILGDSVPPANDSAGTFGWWQLVQMILVLGAVIGLIYLIFYLLKRAGNGRFARTDAIRILGSQTLPGNRALYLVEVGPQVFMIGAAGDSVNLIAEITDRETVDTLVLEAGAERQQNRSFGELIAGMFKGGQGGALDLMRNQRQRLEKLRQ
jgi:flagellar protein FliO/FliZ